MEARAHEVALKFSRRKQEIQAEEEGLLLAAELVEALREWPEEKFAPSDLLPLLVQAEAWGEALAGKRDEKERAAAVGRFIRRFRLVSRERPHGRTLYLKVEAIEKIAAHIPQKSAATAASAATPTKTRPSAAAGRQSDTAAGPQPDAARWAAAADGKHSTSDGFEQTAARETRMDTGPAADAADAAVSSGVQAELFDDLQERPGNVLQEDEPAAALTVRKRTVRGEL